MKEVLYVLGALEDQDVEALMRIGTKEQLQVGDKLLTEGNHPDAIYLVPIRISASTSWSSSAPNT